MSDEMERVGIDPMAGVDPQACLYGGDAGEDTEAWKARRWQNLTASWASALLGQCQYHRRDAADWGMSERAALLRKFRERQELTVNTAMAWGSRCEPRILADAGHIIGVPMVRVNHMYESLVYPRMGATIDGWCLPDPMWEVEAHPEFLDGRDERDTGWLAPLRREVYRLGQEYGPGLVEVKMKRQRAIFKPKGGERDPKMLFERGPEAHHETWGIPYQHAYQVQMQLAVLGSRRAGPQWSMLVTNIGGMDLRAWVCMRDHDFCDYLGEQVAQFWEEFDSGVRDDIHP